MVWDFRSMFQGRKYDMTALSHSEDLVQSAGTMLPVDQNGELGLCFSRDRAARASTSFARYEKG